MKRCLRGAFHTCSPTNLMFATAAFCTAFAPRSAALTSARSAVCRRAAAALTMSSRKQFVLDEFVLRQFDDPSYTGTRIEHDKQAFEAAINAAGAPLVDGYAPFCKHVFVPNFTSAKLNYLKITPENEGALRSGYEARTDAELPVLVRWFPAASAPAPPVAKFLDVILYSREQIRKEAAAMGREDTATEPWGIISVKAQDVDYELPMQPITMMRNTMIDQGGSGVALDAGKYRESVAFWAEHAPIK